MKQQTLEHDYFKTWRPVKVDGKDMLAKTKIYYRTWIYENTDTRYLPDDLSKFLANCATSGKFFLRHGTEAYFSDYVEAEGFVKGELNRIYVQRSQCWNFEKPKPTDDKIVEASGYYTQEALGNRDLTKAGIIGLVRIKFVPKMVDRYTGDVSEDRENRNYYVGGIDEIIMAEFSDEGKPAGDGN